MNTIETTCKIMIYAHRGASGAAPENTLAAFEQAVEKGADGIELDVHLSADGKVIVIHDARIDRTSNGTGEVAYMNYSELLKYDMAAKWKGSRWEPQRIPLLNEVIDIALASGLLLNIELKGGKASPALAEETIKIIRGRGIEDRVILSSFDMDQLRRAKQALPTSKRALITFFPPKPSLGIAEDLWGCHPNHSLTTKGSIDRWKSSGMHIQLWTVNSKDAIIRALKLGADGIITNHPALAATIRQGKIK